MRQFITFLLIILSVSCTSQPITTPEPTSLPSTAREAQETLVRFFSLLNAQDYAEAVPLYGGSYETLQGWNPDIDPTNYAALWERACEQNGLQCLQIRTANFIGLQGDAYVFQVEFNNPDGSLFVQGPCCGADETEMPPVSQFEYPVARTTEGQVVVMELPPYVP